MVSRCSGWWEWERLEGKQDLLERYHSLKFRPSHDLNSGFESIKQFQGQSVSFQLSTLSQRVVKHISTLQDVMEYIINHLDELLLENSLLWKESLYYLVNEQYYPLLEKKESQRFFSLFKVCMMLLSFQSFLVLSVLRLFTYFIRDTLIAQNISCCCVKSVASSLVFLIQVNFEIRKRIYL